jgi:quercetin dioxygenase-like cupin family protein
MKHAEVAELLNGTFSEDMGIVHHFSDGLYAKQMMIPKGFMAGMHKHNYSHLSILAKGKVIVRSDDFEKEYSAPACINLLAEVFHSIEALEDSYWFCIHATNETDVSKIDEVLINKG